MKRLLIVYHTQFGGTGQMARAALAGAQTFAAEAPGVAVELRRAADTGPAEVRAASGLLIAASENFGGVAGAIKDFFERIYYPCETELAGRPYARLICCGNDGAGALRDLDRIAAGLKLARVLPDVVYRSGIVAAAHPVPAGVLSECADRGATLAAGLDAGIY
jgi:multimeric flavodoxin WrbA